MSERFDDTVLDDAAAVQRLDPGEMLRAVATAGAQVREALLAVDEESLAALAAEGRPRAVLVTGIGGSGIVADLAVAVAGAGAPVPVLVSRGHRLPGWVGSLDLVVAVSCSGTTEETLTAADEALRRGARVVTVGAAGSPLAARADDGRALHLAVDAKGRMPRANLWGLGVPVLLVLDALGLADASRADLTTLADGLDAVATTCGPLAETADNPAKQLALDLAGSLPYVWATSELTAVVATRMVAQLAENAKYPAVPGVLPEAGHNQAVVLAGGFGSLARDAEEDLFRDRVEDAAPWPRMRVLLLRDPDELPAIARYATTVHAVAERHRVPSSELTGEGERPLDRLGRMVALTDFASVYLALMQGIDPTPIEPIVLLKAGSAERTGDDR